MKKTRPAKSEQQEISRQMHYRKVIILQLTVASLLGAVLIGGLLLRSDRRDIDPAQMYQRLDENIAVSEIIISEGDSDYISLIQNEDFSWTMRGIEGSEFLARNSRAHNFLEELLSFEFTRLVSKSTGNYRSFGLETAGPGGENSSGGPTTVELKDSQDRLIQRFLFGNTNPETSEQFLLLDGDPNVYAISAGISFYLTQSADYWKEMRLWQPLPNGEQREALVFYRSYADGVSDEWSINENGWVNRDGQTPEYGKLLDNAASTLIRLEGSDLYSNTGTLPENSRLELRIGVETAGAEILEAEIYRWVESNSGDVRYFVKPVRGPWFTSPQGNLRILEIPLWRYERFISF